MTALAQQARWTVAARPDQVGPLRRSVTAYASELGLPSRRLSDLALAAGEAIANAVIHAYRDMRAGTVEVRAGVRDGALVVSVCDEGCGLTPRADSPGLGLGLGLIAQTTDGLRICQGTRCGTEVHMTFRLPVSRVPALHDADAPVPLRSGVRAL